MSGSHWNFKDNLTIDNSRFLKWLDSTGVTRNNVIGLDSDSNLNINSGLGPNGQADIYLNSNNSGSTTFINKSNSRNTIIASKLGVGISNTTNMNSTLVLPNNGWIGLNTTQGTSNGYLGLSGSGVLTNTEGSYILLYGNDSTSGNAGNVNIYAGNVTTGSLNLFTGNSLNRFQILNSGTANFLPDGTTIRLTISDSQTQITNPVVFSNTTVSTSPYNGSLQIAGGVGIVGDTFIQGSLNISSVTGKINFSGSQVSTGYTSGAVYTPGGIGIGCSVSATSQTSGGALSVAGGLALGQNAMFGGNLTIYDSTASVSSQTGSIIAYGGAGINGQVNIRSNVVSQIRIAPVNNNNESSIFFGSLNNYSTSGSWTLGQNSNSIGAGNFAFVNANNGTFIGLNGTSNDIFINKYTNIKNIVNFQQNSSSNFITFTSTTGNTDWAIGRDLVNNNFQISRYDLSGNFINYNITADSGTGEVKLSGTENSSSSSYGGGLTVAGGAAIGKNLYIGGDIIGGTVTFSGSLQSSSSNDVNSFSYLTMTATDLSINITSGAIVSYGGITIQSTADAFSFTNGGTFLTAGGGSFGASLYVGSKIVVNDLVTAPNLRITNATIANEIITNTLVTNETITNSIITNLTSSNIVNTLTSIATLLFTRSTGGQLVTTNLSTSTLNVSTGVTTPALLVTSLISSANTYSTNNTFVNEIITNSSIGVLNVSTGVTTGILYATNIANLSFNSNSIGSVIFTTGGNVGINTSAPVYKLDVYGTTRVITNNPYGLTVDGSNNASGIHLVYNSTGSYFMDVALAGNNGSYSVSAVRGDGVIRVARGNSLYLQTTGTNGSNMMIASSGNVGISTTVPGYTLDLVGTFRSSSTTFIADTVNSVTNSMGAINISGDIALANSTRNTIVFSQAGVGAPTRTTRSLGTKIVAYPSITTTSLDYGLGIENNTLWFSSAGGQFKWYSNTTAANMFLTSDSLGINTNNVAPVYNLDINGTGRFTNSVLATFNSNTIGSLFTTGGNVGINNVSPSFRLDVSGTTRITSGTFAATFNANTIGNIFTTGGNVGIQNTSPNQSLEVSTISYSANQDGGLRISTKNYSGVNDASYRYIDLRLKSDVSSSFRGAIIGTLSGGVPTEQEYMYFSQDGYTYINSNTKFNSNVSSSNSSTGSVVLNGGLSINSATNAINVSNGGSLTVAGGAAIAGDLIVGGSILYSNAAAASSTFAYLTLSASDWSTDVGNGALVTFGGISIQNTANATSATSGNGLTVAGGVGIGADLYVGQTAYIPRVISVNNTTTNIVVTNTTSTNLIVTNVTNSNMYITNGLRATFNSNTIGTLFTTGGNVGIGTFAPTATLTIINDNNPNLDIGSASTGRIRLWGTNIDGYAYFQVGASGSAGNLRISQFNNGTGNMNKIEIYSNTTSISGVLNMTNTLDSSNSTTANIVSSGGISISKTTNSTSVTTGGALTIAGGVGIAKDVYVGGTVTSSSDERLKTNLTDLDSVLDKIDSIRTIKYSHIKNEPEKRHIGFIAQDFEEHFPELLSRENQDAFYALDYTRITVLLMKCIKELKAEIKELKK
jgi:hypothetical protein